MANMLYHATIKSFNGNDLTVKIYSQTSLGTAQELTLAGDNPILVEYSSGDIFKPLKMSSCKVSVITPEPLFKLYTGKINDIYMTVERNNSIIWCGYLRPNVYSQDYEYVDKFDLEFVDFLSTLQYIKFKQESRFFMTFFEYIKEALSKTQSSLITDIYVEDAINIDIGKVGVQCRNFIDETEDEDNGAQTYEEIIEDIAKWMDVSCFQIGTSLYMTRPQYTVAGQYKKYSLSGNGTYTSKTKLTPQLRLYNDIGIAKSDCSISLGDIYNKVTVIENTNPSTEVFAEDILDDSNWNEYMYKKDGNYYETGGFYRLPWKKTVTKKDSDEQTRDYVYNYIDCRGYYTTNKNWEIFVGRYDQKQALLWKGYPWQQAGRISCYKKGTSTATVDVDETKNKKTVKYNTLAVPCSGGYLAGHSDYTDASTTTAIGDFYYQAGAVIMADCYYQTDSVPSSLSFDKNLWLYYNMDMLSIMNNIYNSSGKKEPTSTTFIKYTSPKNSSVAFKGGYLILSLDYTYYDTILSQFELAEVVAGYDNQKCSQLKGDANYGFIKKDSWKCKLRIGDKWYSEGGWTTTESTFEIGHTWKDDEYILGTKVSLDNSNTYDQGLEDTTEGVLIPIGDKEISGPVYFEMCPPVNFARYYTDWDSPGHSMYLCGVKISTLTLKYSTTKEVGNLITTSDLDNTSDITIFNVIDDNNVIEMDDYTLRVNTYNPQQASYSYVLEEGTSDNTIQHDGVEYKFIEKITANGETLIQEQRILKKLVNYYSEPKLTYTNILNDKGNINLLTPIYIESLNRDMVVDEIQYDLAMDNAEVTLKEI